MNDKAAKPYLLSASLVCANMLDIRRDVISLENAGIDYIHFDVMDGLSVQRYGLHPEMLAAVRSMTAIPVDVHLMVVNPEPYIGIFAEAGASIITVHAEGNHHLHRTLSLIKKKGIRAGIALNPATSLHVLDYILPDVDLILLMAINPGIVGHPLWEGVMKKIEDIRELLGNGNAPLIEIDGGVTFESAPVMIRKGANMLVCGSSTIFKKNESIETKVFELRNVLSSSEPLLMAANV